jgi:hypothetical protein
MKKQPMTTEKKNCCMAKNPFEVKDQILKRWKQ